MLDSVDLSNNIVIVTGLPRTGTSLMMQMLEAGGIPIYSDGIRRPDSNNMNGYYEVEAVKNMDEYDDWLRYCYGKALKVISPYFYYLPLSYDYLIIRCKRNLDSVIASSRKMASPSKQIRWEEVRFHYESHIKSVAEFIAINRLPSLTIDFDDVISRPDFIAKDVNRFLGGNLDIEAMIRI